MERSLGTSGLLCLSGVWSFPIVRHLRSICPEPCGPLELRGQRRGAACDTSINVGSPHIQPARLVGFPPTKIGVP